MAALEAPFSIFSFYSPTFSKFPLCPKLSQSIRLRIPASTPTVSPKFPPSTLPLLSINPTRKSTRFEVCSAVQEIAVEENPDPQTQQQPNQRRKLFVLNLPWSFSVDDIKNLFSECGTVADVEIIKHKDGKNRGFAFVTMDSGEAAQAVMNKFDSHELLGRIIKVEFAKKFKKPSRPPPAALPAGETRHKLYVSNLAWKVRSNHLREFFAANFNLVSARVVFDSPSGKSGGYGFVSFATKEEAEAAISALDGKELMGRPVRLKFSIKNIEESADGKENIEDGKENIEESADGKEEEDISEESEQSESEES